MSDKPTSNDRRYSGEGRTGICVCGCPWDSHHLGVVLNAEYVEATGEAYIPQECEAYGFNETGGYGPNGEPGHCNSYRDSALGECK